MDYYSGFSGNQLSRLKLSLTDDFPPYASPWLWQGFIGLDSDYSLAGGIATTMTETVINDAFAIWVSLGWLEGSPTAPHAGVVKSTGEYLKQYIFPMADSGGQPIECFEQFMVGIRLLNWVNGVNELIDSGQTLFFDIRYTSDTLKPDETLTLVDSIDIDSLHATITPEKSGFISISAVDDDSTISSQCMYLDKDKHSTLVVTPSRLKAVFTSSTPDTFYFKLGNIGDEAVDFRLDYDTLLFSIQPVLGILNPNESDDIRLSLNLSSDEDSLINSDIIINSDNWHYPLIYHLSFHKDHPLDVENTDIGSLPAFGVSQPFPNPSNSEVKIIINTSGKSDIQLEVYNILGQSVFSGTMTVNKSQTIKWDFQNPAGEVCPSGIYFFCIRKGDISQIRKVLLLK